MMRRETKPPGQDPNYYDFPDKFKFEPKGSDK